MRADGFGGHENEVVESAAKRAESESKMTDPINQEHEEVLNFAHSLPSGLAQEQIYIRIHERARAIPPAAAAAGLPAGLVPKWAGQFDTFDDWVRRAQRVLSVPAHKPGAICVDAKGRRCHIGADMARARDEGAFPVRYFWECEVAALPADPVDESQPADERAKFDAWWSEFTDEHDDWCYADSSALRWAAFKAGAALSAPVAPVTPKAIEEITDILLWPVTEDDARTARDMLQSIHFDLSMAENVAPVPAASDLPALLEEAAKALESSAECDEESDVDPFAVQYARDLAKRLRGWAMEAQSHE